MAGESGTRAWLLLGVSAVVFAWMGAAAAEAGALATDSCEPAPAINCSQRTFRHVDYDVIHVDLRKVDLRLFWKDEQGEALQTFKALKAHLEQQGLRALFAINSGIYARDYTPLGLHIEGGVALEPLNRKRGGGNFFLKPNGVFYVDDSGGHIAETEVFAERDPNAKLAVQSGPLLLNDGDIHPVFEPGSDSRHIRNGVGSKDAHHIVFAITHFPVNLHDFASFFKEELQCSDALYLDGAISGMYAPDCGRNDNGGEYVGMLAIVEEVTAEEAHGEE
jgi:uncharacterized protein YigE (DUF2233 family)